MNVTRMDLADAASPERIVQEILKQEPNLPVPVPIEELSRRLDIIDITPLKTDGYEGGLLTSRDKFNGSILFNAQSPRKRTRFTIAHELGHFLIPSHIPSDEGGFLCRVQDMLALKANEGDRRQKMEVEANRFAALILMPPPLFRPDAAQGKEPNLRQIVALAARYDVSKEAAARAYVQFRDEPVAIVITQNGKLLREYRNQMKFPALTVTRGTKLPAHVLLMRRKHEIGAPGEIDETDAGIWIDIPRGRTPPTLYEQVLLQQSGFALIMLWLERPEDYEDDDPEAELTSKQRLHRRMGEWDR